MNKLAYIGWVIAMQFMISCNNKKNSSEVYQSVVEHDSMHSDTLQHSSTDRFADNHMPTSPREDKYSDGQQSPKGKSHHFLKTDNMRGFDPASEDDMEDNGMSRYMENNDEEGWD